MALLFCVCLLLCLYYVQTYICLILCQFIWVLVLCVCGVHPGGTSLTIRQYNTHSEMPPEQPSSTDQGSSEHWGQGAVGS